MEKDSIFNCIPQFRDEIRLEILRADDSSEEGEKHEFDVTTSCSFPLTKLDGRFKFTNFPCRHFDHPCLIDNETARPSFATREISDGTNLSVSHVTRESETGFESFGIYHVCFSINGNGNGAVRRIIWGRVNSIRNTLFDGK